MRGVALFLAALALSVPLAAQEQPADDIVNRIINAPGAANHRVDGTKGKVRNDEAVQGGKALRIAVPGKSDQPWSISVSSSIEKPVKAGDRLVLAFWARLEKGEGGATTAVLPYNAVQLSAAPYSALFHGPATITPEWKMHEVKGRADKDYAAGTLNVAIHLATAKQTVDVGPIFVLNMGQ